jgi:hypothetical protein
MRARNIVIVAAFAAAAPFIQRPWRDGGWR